MREGNSLKPTNYRGLLREKTQNQLTASEKIKWKKKLLILMMKLADLKSLLFSCGDKLSAVIDFKFTSSSVDQLIHKRSN